MENPCQIISYLEGIKPKVFFSFLFFQFCDMKKWAIFFPQKIAKLVKLTLRKNTIFQNFLIFFIKTKKIYFSKKKNADQNPPK
jgi:hypothetical protein